MAVLPVRVYPDPILRSPARPVTSFDAALQSLVADLVETMHAAPGIGLAAPQVGRGLRVAVVDLSVGQEPGALHVLVNPELRRGAGRGIEVEGCLSLPGLQEKVARPTQIELEAKDFEGTSFRLSAEGLLARAICHELDHLDGVLFVDRLTGLRRERAKRWLSRLAAPSSVPVGGSA